MPEHARYRAVLSDGPLRQLLFAAFLSRIPMGVESFASIFYFREHTGSFGAAGGVAGAISAGLATGSVALGRLVDARGRKALAPLGAAHLLLIVLLLAAGVAAWPLWITMPAAFLVGGTLPPTFSFARSLYSPAVGARAHLESPVFALDAALTEAVWMIGPAFVSLAVLVADPALALLAGALLALSGVVLILRLDVAPGRRPVDAPSRSHLLAVPAMRTLVLASFPLGVTFGAFEIALPAFATEEGVPAVAGVILTIMAAGGLVGALGYGASRRAPRPAITVVLIAIAFPPVSALALLASSVWAMVLLVVPLGLLNGPWATARNRLVAASAPPGSTTEAFGWFLFSVVWGMSVGAAIGGAVLDHADWRVAWGLGSVVSLASTALFVLGRDFFEPRASRVQGPSQGRQITDLGRRQRPRAPRGLGR